MRAFLRSFALAALCSLSCGAPQAEPPQVSPAASSSAPQAADSVTPPAPEPEPEAPPKPFPKPPPKRALHLERTIDAGKWPESVIVTGDTAWVAESGNRRIVRWALDKEAPPAVVRVGRLPVELAIGPKGQIYTVAETDKTLWEIDPVKTKGRVIATVGHCPQSFVVADGSAWILQWTKCSSSRSSIVRIGLDDHKEVTSSETGDGAWAIAHAGDRSWIARGDDTMSVVSGAELREVAEFGAPQKRGGSRKMVTGPGGVYVTSDQTVARIDPARAERSAGITLNEHIHALFADGDRVLAAGKSGTIWVLAPDTLAVREELLSPGGEPHAIARYGEKILVIDHGEDGLHGRLRIFSVP